MTPFEELEAVALTQLPKIRKSVKNREVGLHRHDLIDAAYTDLAAVKALADALCVFYAGIKDERGSISGVPNGKADADRWLQEIIVVCAVCNIPPPWKLADAIEIRLGLTVRDHRFNRDRPRRRRRGYRPNKLYPLIAYYRANPGASQRQAAKDLGMSRNTIRAYKARPDWERLVGQ